MNNNLFFEGPVRSGKSTALRQALCPYLSQLGGFVVQRLLDEAGHPAAYRLLGLPNLVEDMGQHQGEAQFLAVDAPYTGQESDVFLRIPSRQMEASVFENVGLLILKTSKMKKIILLDEIGGVELAVPSFRKALISLLQGPTPCIGIIKETNKAREALPYHEGLRSLISVESVTYDTLSEIPLLVNEHLERFYSSK